MSLRKVLLYQIPIGTNFGLANSFSIGITLMSLLFAITISFANNITVSNVALKGKNTSSDYVLVQFDISWENSWRVSSGPSNWDAAWVFVKYRHKTQITWNHATLNWADGTGTNDGHTEPANTNIASSNDNGSNGAYGVFIYRDADMAQGSVNYTGVKLRWNYGVDLLQDEDSVEVCVFAIEMVYVPQASFYVGDGTSSNIRGQFEDGITGSPLQITSEGALTLGGGGAGSLGNNNAAGMTTADDFNDVTSQSLPAAFPKGYNAFYCMKYEITQVQYVDFLNKLIYNQQATRTALVAPPNSAAGTGALVNPNIERNGIDIMTPGVATSTPAVYACNLNGNGTYNEADDGQSISCNHLTWADVSAYFDWAALRPMTELEFEKAARGTLAAVANEYAWGSTSITNITGISNSGYTNETASNAGANCIYNGAIGGPVRVGNFGQGVNTRVDVGAGYYGILDLSGNNWEKSVTVGNATGRTFTGNNGNGILTATGNPDVTNWPGTDAIGSGLRGGSWQGSAITARISDRVLAATTYTYRGNNFGGRGVRAAP